MPFIWQATDQSWETKGWGLIDLTSQPKPVFYALRTLWPSIPVGAQVVDLGDQSGGLIYGGAFVDDDRLVIGLANDSDAQVDKTVRVTGATGVQIIEAPACIIDHQGDPAIEDPDTAQVVYRTVTIEPDNSFEVTLPADSTLAIVCDLVFAAADLNRDGDVDLDDHAIIVDCLAGPNVTTPPPGCTAGHFGTRRPGRRPGCGPGRLRPIQRVLWRLRAYPEAVGRAFQPVLTGWKAGPTGDLG